MVPDSPVPEFDPTFDAYAALGLTSTAKAAEIKAAHRAIISANHPDALPKDATTAEKATADKKCKAAAKAWSYVGSPTARKAYDTSRQGPIGRTVEKVTADPRVRDMVIEIRDRAAKVAADKAARDRDKPRVERPPLPRIPTRDSTRVPDPPTPRGDRPSPLDERAGRRRPSDVQRRGPTPIRTPLERAFESSKSLRESAVEHDIRDGETLVLSSGVKYSFRRVLYTVPGEPTPFRMKTPVVVRGDEVIAPCRLVTKQGLTTATDATCAQFTRERDDVSKALYLLVSQREMAKSMAEELRAIMTTDERIEFNGASIRPRLLAFSDGSKRTNLTVLCVDNQIIEMQPGQPLDPSMKYADETALRLINANYLALRALAAAQARAKGRNVPAITEQRVGNTFRVAKTRLGGLFSEGVQ